MRLAVASAACTALLGAPPAAAVPDCTVKPAVRDVATDQGRLESIIGDARGRLFYTDLTQERLLRLDGPGQQPKVLGTEMRRPGGLEFRPDGTLMAGFNGGALSGVPGNAMAGLFRVDPESGAKQVVTTGLDQANGLVRGPDDSLYTSNNIGGEIARVLPDGRVDAAFAKLDSPNGLAIDSEGRFLFAAQTFRPANIVKVDLAAPSQVTPVFTAGPADAAAGLDGLTRDAADRLYVAANGLGEVWRVDPDGAACALARSITTPSALAFGGGGSFAPSNLYVVTFGGRVVELAGATDRPPGAPGSAPGATTAARPLLRLTVRPSRVGAGRRVRLRFTVTSGGSAVSGATVRLGRGSAVTDAAGRAGLVQRFSRAGSLRVRASRAGYRAGTATVRVLPARRTSPAFTG